MIIGNMCMIQDNLDLDLDEYVASRKVLWRIYSTSQKKMCKIVCIRTSSNFHQWHSAV